MLLSINLLQNYLQRSADLWPHKSAIIFHHQRITYTELEEESTRIAMYMRSVGVERGDRVVIALGNGVDTVKLFWAVLKAGAVVSIINPELPDDKLHYIIRDSGCSLYFTRSNWDDKSKKINEYNGLELLTEPLLDMDLASIIYTSGSTGEPKGVMMTHRNMITALESINTYLGNTEDEVILSALPLSFDYGLYQMLMAISVGATLVLEKDFRLPLQFARRIEQERVTALPGVPTLFSILSDTCKRFSFDTSSVRYVTNTGAAVYGHHIQSIQALFPQAQFFSMYGLTECKRCTYLPPEDIYKKPHSVGRAIPNTEMWIVNNHGEKLGSNEIGQLVIRGGTVMQGYWNKPLETNQKLKSGLFPNEKVLYTGDFGYLDEEGYFYFKGRMDEEIKSRGVKVSPKEIEEVLNAISWIQEAAVIGLPHPTLGHEIVAYVVCELDHVFNPNEILEHCKEKLEAIKLPHRIYQMKALPKSCNGKINKQDILLRASAC